MVFKNAIEIRSPQKYQGKILGSFTRTTLLQTTYQKQCPTVVEVNTAVVVPPAVAEAVEEDTEEAAAHTAAVVLILMVANPVVLPEIKDVGDMVVEVEAMGVVVTEEEVVMEVVAMVEETEEEEEEPAVNVLTAAGKVAVEAPVEDPVAPPVKVVPPPNTSPASTAPKKTK